MNPYQSPRAGDPRHSELEESLQPADRVSRFAAYIIDLLVLGTAYSFLFHLVALNWPEQLGRGPFSVPLRLAVLSSVVYWLLNGYFLYRSGQTIGKKILGIQIVRSDGQVPGLGWLFLRRMLPTWFMYWCPILNVLLFPLDSLLIFRQSGQCLHDQFADTHVVWRQ